MNILITGAWKDALKHIEQISQNGHNVVFMQNESDKLPCSYDWVNGVVCNGLFLSHDIGKFTNLSYIQLTSAGYDRVPIDYIRSRNIKLFNAKGVYSIPMAEFAVSSVLQIYKKSFSFYENKKKCIWNKQRDLLELYGKTVGILGCGNVGTECAKRFKIFGCKIIGFDIVFKENEFYDETHLISELNKYLPELDVLILCVPLNKDTQRLISGKLLENLKNNAVIVNISRGGVIDTDALSRALTENKLLGAALDVFEEEPLLETNPLWKLPNLIISPHNSFVGDNVDYRLSKVVMDNIKEI